MSDMVPRPRRGQLILSHQLAARYPSSLPLGSSVSPGLLVRMFCDVVSIFPVSTRSHFLPGVLRDPRNATRKSEPSNLGSLEPSLPSLQCSWVSGDSRWHQPPGSPAWSETAPISPGLAEFNNLTMGWAPFQTKPP